jgi:predicted acetyltransferase
VELVSPSLAHLATFRDAVVRGWSPSSEPGGLERITRQLSSAPAVFLASLDDREAQGAPITLPDGSTVPRLPGFEMWMWDGAFCGRIQLRWRPGTPDLPPTCLGHIGYSVVPWRRNRGYARTALRQLLPLAREVGLPWVELTTDVGNVASQRVILANGGRLVEQFTKPASYGEQQAALRYRIRLDS